MRGGGGKLRVQLLEQSASDPKSETDTKQDVSKPRRVPHLALIKSAASVEVGAPGILQGASGIGAATLTGIW